MFLEKLPQIILKFIWKKKVMRINLNVWKWKYYEGKWLFQVLKYYKAMLIFSPFNAINREGV